MRTRFHNIYEVADLVKHTAFLEPFASALKGARRMFIEDRYPSTPQANRKVAQTSGGLRHLVVTCSLGCEPLPAQHADVVVEDRNRPIGIDSDMQGFGNVHIVPGTLANSPEVLYKR